MKHLDSDFEKGPTIFKEEITSQEVPFVIPKEPEKETTEEEEFVPEISGVEYDEFLVPRPDSTEKLQLTTQINVDAQEVKEGPSDKDLKPRFEVDVSEAQVQEPLDLRLDLSAFKSSDESDEKEPERVETTGELEAPKKPEPEFDEQYQFKIPKEGYPFLADKHFAVDMSVRTEDEVSELPESEIASMISDRKEIERRESDVSLSDNEYSEKGDDVSISDSSEESPYTTKKPAPFKEMEVSEQPKPLIGESDFDITLGTPSEVSTDVTFGTDVAPTSDTKQLSQAEEAEADKSMQEYAETVLKQAVDEESPDEYDESIGAIPAKVFGEVYMEEISKLTEKPIAADAVFQAGPGVVSTEEDKLKEIQPDKEESPIIDVEEEEYESGEEEIVDGVARPKRRFLLHERGDRDKLKAYPETYLADQDETPKDGTYVYGEGSPRPKLRHFQKLDDSETSESEATTSPSEGSFLVPSSDSHRQSEESIETPIRSEEEAQDSTVEETTESESTIKEEFITKVDSLDEQPQQLISVREYISSEEEEQRDFVVTADTYDYDVRAESPIIETGFSAELELSRITEDEEPEGTESESSEVSQESVQEVPGYTFRDEALQQIPEEGEPVDVTVEVLEERERMHGKGEVIEEEFTLEQSLQAEAQAPAAGLHIEHEVICLRAG